MTAVSGLNVPFRGPRGYPGANGTDGTGIDFTRYDIVAATINTGSANTQVVANDGVAGTIIFFGLMVCQNIDPTEDAQIKIRPQIGGVDVTTSVVYHTIPMGTGKATVCFQGQATITAVQTLRLVTTRDSAAGGFDILDGNVLYQIIQ